MLTKILYAQPVLSDSTWGGVQIPIHQKRGNDGDPGSGFAERLGELLP